MAKDSKEIYEFKRKIKFLSKQKGEGTELISVYISPKGNANEVSSRLRDEYSQAMNIKSKKTRKNVQAAIDRIVNILKGVNKAPENGIAIFAGMLNEKIESFEIIPPLPVNISIYRCDSTFFTEPLENISGTEETYGLLVLDRREATVATLKGKAIKIIKRMRSGVPGKHHKGGQSANRMQRLIEQAAHEFFKKIGNFTNEIFLNENIKGVLVGGSGPTKHYFVKENYFNNNVKKKIVEIVDTGYTDETGIRELVEGAQDALKNLDVLKEKKLIEKFLREAVTNGLATYGINEVKQAIKIGQVDTLLLSEELDDDLIDELMKMAEEVDAKIEMISTDTPEGSQFFQGFGGIGVLLRYK